MKRSDINFARNYLGVVFILLSCMFFGCESEYSTPSNTDALVFSTDTVSFDTLFVGDKSETYALKLYNKSDKNVIIDQILLEGGELSHYDINIDGDQIHSISGVELASKDSLYIFLNIKCPVITEAYCTINDKVTLRVGNLTKSSIVTTFVQNVNILDNVTIDHNTTLTATLPYRVMGELKVNEGATLNIPPDAKLYMTRGSRIEVYGALVAIGDTEKRITIHSDRLTDFYDDIPGQWEYICINKNANAQLRCVDISNAKYALQIDSTATVDIYGSTLRDASANLIYSRFANVSVLNSLLYNCGSAAIEDQGSNIDIIHSTISNHFSWDYRKKAAVICNPYDENKYGTILIANTIIEGNQENELDCKSESLKVDHCAITVKKEADISNDARYTNVISTRKINFVDVKQQDFHVQPTSEAVENGNRAYSSMCPYDFEGNKRNFAAPTIGAYECLQQESSNE